jgi:hypothetical protein
VNNLLQLSGAAVAEEDADDSGHAAADHDDNDDIVEVEPSPASKARIYILRRLWLPVTVFNTLKKEELL